MLRLCVRMRDVKVFFSSTQNKLDGTVWMDVDDAKVFKILDLDDIEKTFSAYQRQQVLRMLQFISPTHQMLPSSAREYRGGWTERVAEGSAGLHIPKFLQFCNFSFLKQGWRERRGEVR